MYWRNEVPIFELSVKDHFSAAHALAGYNGPCANQHGHNYKVEAKVICNKLNEIGLGIDLKELKNALSMVLKKLDHTNLNTLPFFQEPSKNPSSENIAVYIYNELKKSFNTMGVALKEVTVSESEGAQVVYRESE